MTFDEALKELDDDTRVTDEDEIEYTVGLDFGTVESVVEELRATYAPTIEMTQAQYDELLGFKHKFGSSHLAAAIHQGNDGTWSFLDELSGRIFGHGIGEATDKNIETIMQAWLHPECVKVVDDD